MLPYGMITVKCCWSLAMEIWKDQSYR